MSGQRQKIKGILAKTMYDSSRDNLIPLTEMADNLGIKARKHDFDDWIEETLTPDCVIKDGTRGYLEVYGIKVKYLYSDRDYQRLMNETMIKKAGKFDGRLCRPLFIFRRPDGKFTVADGQHTGSIGYLYTNQGKELVLPCQVICHPSDRSLLDCITVEAKFFEDLNKNRTSVGTIDLLKTQIAYGDKDAIAKEQILISMGVRIGDPSRPLGDPNGYDVSGLTRLFEAAKVGNDIKYAREAIKIYSDLVVDEKCVKWTDKQAMLGSLICGLARILYLRDTLGRGDKAYVVDSYLNKYLQAKSPESLTEGKAGNTQSHLIALTIIGKINDKIEDGDLTKRDGTLLKHQISEGDYKNAGIIDPTK